MGWGVEGRQTQWWLICDNFITCPGRASEIFKSGYCLQKTVPVELSLLAIAEIDLSRLVVIYYVCFLRIVLWLY